VFLIVEALYATHGQEPPTKDEVFGALGICEATEQQTNPELYEKKFESRHEQLAQIAVNALGATIKEEHISPEELDAMGFFEEDDK